MKVSFKGYADYVGNVLQSFGEAQRFLDGDNRRSHTAHGLAVAMVVEIGELGQALKPEWAWWKRADKQFEYGSIGDEVADILHFVLAELNRQEDEGVSKPGNAFSIAAWRLVDSVLLDNPETRYVGGNLGDAMAMTEYGRLVPLGQFPQRDLLEQIASPYSSLAGGAVVNWALRVVMAYDDLPGISSLYYAKAAENLARWGREDDISKLKEFEERSREVFRRGFDIGEKV